MRMLKKLTSVLLTALLLQSVVVTGTVMTTSAYQTDKTDSQTQTQKTVSTDTVYSDFEYSVSDNKVTVTKYTGTDTEVVIPSEIDGLPVTAIGNNTFQDSAQTITGITIPQSVTSIGNYAFYACPNLTSITIPDNVVNIGDYAFCATGLTSVTIPENVTSIGLEAFGECGNLTSIHVDSNNTVYSSADGVLFNKAQTTLIAYPAGKTDTSYTIPNSVTSLENFAFICCQNLRSITIPTSVTYIGMCEFYSAHCLMNIYYTGSESQWQSITINDIGNYWLNHVQYGNNDFQYSISDNQVTITKYIGSATNVVIPSEIDGKTVTSIGDSAFENCSMLESLTIPTTITCIGSAFYGCDNLQYVYYLGTLTQWQQMTHHEFFGYQSSICFTNETFEYGYDDHYGIILLKYKGNETHVVIPSEIDGIPVWSTGGFDIFGNNNTMESITIPKNVSIYHGSFAECSNMIDIYYEGTYTQWSQYLFDFRNVRSVYFQNEDFEYSCDYFYPPETYSSTFGVIITKYKGNATQVTVPSEIDGLPVLNIYSNAFENNSTLESVTFPENVNLYYNVFVNCSNLKSVTGYYGLTMNAFSNCSRLQELHFLGSYEEWKSCNRFDIINMRVPMYFTQEDFEYRIDMQTGIRFTKYTGTDSNVTIPSRIADSEAYPYVTTIGAYTFEGRDLESITIPGDVTCIEDNAFYNCYLQDIYFAGNREMWNEITAKVNSTMFTGVTIHYGILTYNDFEYIVNNNTVEIVRYLGNDEQVVIPAEINGMPVKGIGVSSEITGMSSGRVFNNYESLKSVTLPEGLTSIGSYAFAYCSQLTAITIPNGVTSIEYATFTDCSSLTNITIPNSVTSIGSCAFYNCSSLTNITIPNSVTSIENSAFDKCTALISVAIPNSVTRINDYVFYNCSSLTSIILPDSVTKVGYSAFRNCSSLTSISIPDSVTSIGSYTFYGCSSLTSVTIPNSIKSIGSGVFEDCSSLTSISIPDSVTSIGLYAFENCSSLTSVEIPNSVTSIASSAFSGCSSLTAVTIPNSVTSINDYVFYNCSSLTSIILPDSVTSIGNKSFGYYYSKGYQKVNGFTITGHRGSAAETYANNNSFTFIAISDSRSVADCTVTLSKDSYVYNATQRKPDVTVVYGTETLTKDTDYTVSYENNINAGTASVIITGINDYSGTKTETFTITGKPISQTTITLSPTSYIYDGTAKTPTVTVVSGKKTLTENTDYTVSYENNVNIGKANVTITGIGNYSGTATKTFTITGEPVDNATITLSQDTYIYNGYQRKPDVTVALGTETLTKGTDYKVSYKDNINAGTATVTITGMGNYSGTASKTFTIEGKSIKQAKATLSQTAYDYDGTAKTPEVTVTYSTKTLTEHTDYTVSYENNINAGTASVIITGMGNYSGTMKKTFTIERKSLENATATLSKDSYVYNGYQRKPDVTVVLDTETLTKDTDYKVSYKDNINAGTATVTITGTGNYSGTLIETFTITGKPMSQTKVALEQTSYTYDGTAKTPAVTVTYSTKTLTENTDYTVSYENNIETGTASVIITGMGNYAETVTKTFTIDN